MRSSLLSGLACLALLSACAKNMNSNAYTESATPGKVLEGTVISTRAVTIKAHDKLEENTTGGLAGGIAGGVAGSEIGSGSGSAAATIGGVLIGAVAGALVQDQLGTQDGMEYLVRLDKKYLQEYHVISKKVQSNGKQNIEQDMATNTNVGTRSDIVSVVQVADPALHKGSHVYLIYNDDRPRLEAQE